MNVPAELRSDTLLHSTLISRAAIFQAKGHGDIAISPKGGDECSFYLIFYSQFDLVIASCGIQKTYELTASRRINHLIDTGQSKRILGAGLIQASVIYTHAPSSILLHNQNWVC